MDASIEVQENLNKRIITKQNRSDSVYMNVYNQVRKFEPFAHLNSQLKANIILTLPDSSPQKALFLNFKQITEDIIANNPEFLLLPYDRQRDLLEAKAVELASKAVAQNSVREIRGFNITDWEDMEPDPEEI